MLRFSKIVIMDLLQHVWYFSIMYLILHLKEIFLDISLCNSNSVT